MATAIKICRICGKAYEACRSANRSAGVFRWQEVACSPECGAAYMKKIQESRNASEPPKKNRHKKWDAPPAENSVTTADTATDSTFEAVPFASTDASDK